MSIPDHLITPLDWSAEALRHAAEWTGQPVGARALVESRRYLAMHELIERLRRERDEARQASDMLRLCMNDAACRALVSERDQLAARLAEIERAADLDVDIIEAQRAVVQQLAGRPACDWPGNCKHQRQATADTPELAEPADPRTPPPGCRLLGDYEPARAGDMAYIGAIAGRWRRVKPRMGIIGATMDELSDGARVLALARPCRCTPDDCPKGGAA